MAGATAFAAAVLSSHYLRLGGAEEWCSLDHGPLAFDAQVWHSVGMGNKDHKKREVRKPKKKTPDIKAAPKTSREAFDQGAVRVQEAFRRSES